MNKVASVKQSSGSGFIFENQIVAYAMIFMLSGRSPISHLGGELTRIDCQLRVDGWYLDDLVLEIVQRGKPVKVAFSIKSNSQFSKCKAPQEFVGQAWRQYLNDGSQVFNQNSDWLGLITSPLSEPERIAIPSLLSKARKQKPAILVSRLKQTGYANDCERTLFDSFAPPEDLAKKLNVDESYIGLILKRTIVLDYDFGSPESKDLATSLFLCSNLLSHETSTKAELLWSFLCNKADEVRAAGGGISRQELIDLVKANFELREYPDYHNDWEYLRNRHGVSRAFVEQTIAGKVIIERDDLLHETIETLSSHSYVVLMGQSGSGKSSLLKTSIEQLHSGFEVLWFDAGSLRQGLLLDLEKQLDHAPEDTFSKSNLAKGIVVIDGLERLRAQEDFEEAGRLIKILLSISSDYWSIVATCREDDWNRVSFALSEYTGIIPWSAIKVDYPLEYELGPVWETYPQLRRLTWHPGLISLLTNLKLIDALARALELGHIPPDRPLSESDLIDWWWEQIILASPKGLEKSDLLKRLAILEVDDGLFQRGISNLNFTDLELIPLLDNILVLNQPRETVAYSHDMYADWARYRRIKEEDNPLAFCADKALIPQWHKAIRFFAMHYLSSDDGDDKWLEVFQKLTVTQNFFLESLVFSAGVKDTLESLNDILLADEGKLLKMFLSRFLHVATAPNEFFMKLAAKGEMDAIAAATVDRIPRWAFWPGVLAYLSQHSDDVLRLASEQVVSVASSWLKNTPPNTPLRQEAALIALKAGYTSYMNRRKWRAEKAHQAAYEAMLLAFPDKPKEVEKLALKVSGRTIPEPDDGDYFIKHKPAGTVEKANSIFPHERIYQEPWPNGPKIKPDDCFRRACLEKGALEPIMRHRPKLARELILSLLIELRPPKQYPDYYSDSARLPIKMGLTHDFDFYPRFYTRGPFILFLNIDPYQALNIIITLVDFATERWLKINYTSDLDPPMIELPLSDDVKRFIGDDKVFHFYHGHAQSNIISSSLMAIEKWCYMQLEVGSDIKPFINHLLNNANSAAFLGVLGEIGRFKPELFTGVLQPLLTIWEMYFLESVFKAQQSGLGTPFSMNEGEWFFNAAREWDNMDHRNFRLIDIAVNLFFSDKHISDKMNEAQQNWINLLPGIEDNNKKVFLTNLIESFNKDNWQKISLPNGTQGVQYCPPEHLALPPEEEMRQSQEWLLLTLPMHCRQILEGEKILSVDDLPTFLKQAQELETFRTDDELLNEPSRLADALSGTASVLLIKHSQWLKSHPDEKRWCVEAITRLILDPPHQDYLYPAETFADSSWESFVGEAIIILWKREPNNENVRRLLAKAVTAHYYGSVGYLLRQAYNIRHQVNDDFWRLFVLILEWAKVRYKHRTILQYKESPDELDDQAKDELQNLTKGWSAFVDSFVSGQSPTDPGPWGKIVLDEGRLWWGDTGSIVGDSHRDGALFRAPSIDVQQIQAAIGGLFLPNEAKDDSELLIFIGIWKQIETIILAGCFAYDKSRNRAKDYETKARLPYEYEIWGISRLAHVVAGLKDDDLRRDLWQPILALGGRAKTHVTSFLHELFNTPLRFKNQHNFFNIWKEMIEFCLSNSIWTKPGHWYYKTPDLWLTMLGMPDYVETVFTEDESDLVKLMQPYHNKLVSLILKDSHRASRYISWLSKPCAKSLRLHILSKILKKAKAARDYWWDNNVAYYLAILLSDIWYKQRNELESDLSLLEIFHQLLHLSAMRQEKIALELSTRIGSGKY